MNFSKLFLLVLTFFLCCSCGFFSKPKVKLKKNNQGLFEGEINFKYNHDYKDSNIKFLISKDTIIRDQIGNILFIPKSISPRKGMLVDLTQKKIVLYYYDFLVKKIKSELSFSQFNKIIAQEMFPEDIHVTTYDYSFSYFKKYTPFIRKENILDINGLKVSYTLYKEDNQYQEVFDSSSFAFDKQILPLVFPNIPNISNFPIGYIHHNTDTNNDLPDLSDSDEVLDRKILKTFNSLSSETSFSLLSIIQRKIVFSNYDLDLSSYDSVSIEEFISSVKISSSSGNSGGFGFDID